MILSPAVEYLLSRVDPGGGRPFPQEGTQLLIPIFPPNTTLSLEGYPTGDYAHIIYGVGFGSNMVPDAFTGYVQIWGGRYVSGTFTTRVLGSEIQGFVWTTMYQPLVFYITNVSGLNQVFELVYTYIRITSEENYFAVLEELRHLGTSAKSEQLAEEANRLLGVIAGGPPLPKPLIGGR